MPDVTSVVSPLGGEQKNCFLKKKRKKKILGRKCTVIEKRKKVKINDEKRKKVKINC